MSRDPCPDIRDRFSDLLEGRLDEGTRAAIDAHLAACDACRAEWSSFSAAVDVLRDHAPAGLRRGEFRQILDAVDDEARRVAGNASAAADPRDDAFRRAMTGAPRTSGRGRSIATHAAALALGVAAAAVVLPGLGFRAPASPRSEIVPPTTGAPAAAREVALALEPGTGLLLRDGRPVDAGSDAPVVPRPGDVLRVAPGAGLSLVLGDAGSVRIEAPPAEVPPPEIVEREVPVERIRYVSRGPLVTIDGPAFEHAIVRFEGLVRTVGTQVSDLVERAEPSPREPRAVDAGPTPSPARRADPVVRAPSPDVVEVTPAPPAPEPTPPVARRSTADLPAVASAVVADEPRPRPVLVRRIGNRLRIETFGAPYEVIPDLIAHLDSGDPDVAEGARLRLEEIRESLVADPDLAARLADPAAQEGDGGTLAFVKGLFGDEPPPAPRSETESWQAWWERNAIHILEAGTWGTF